MPTNKSRSPSVVLLVLAALLRVNRREGRPVSRRNLATESGLPPGAVQDALEKLTAGQIVTGLPGEADRYLPRELQPTMTVGDVLARLKILPSFAEPPVISDSPELQLPGQGFLEGLTFSAGSHPALADLDGDGDLDLFVGTDRGEIHYFRNNALVPETTVSDSG